MSGTTIPLVMTAAGPVATAPAALLAAIQNAVAAQSPGYTILPAGLIEDILDTQVGGLTEIDQARIDAVNAVTPLASNAYILNQLGQQFGIPQGTPTNTSVYVQFSGSAGYNIPPGFTVSDGTYQYVTQSGTAIPSSGPSQLVLAVATQSGTWAVPENTVQSVITSVASTYTVTCNNPAAGILSQGSESVPSYRSRVLQSGQAATTGLPTTLKTALQAIPGVSPQQVGIIQGVGGYEILCNGGSTQAIAAAILASVPDITTLQSSVISVTGITQANPGVVTVNKQSAFANGSVISFTGVGGMTELNSGTYTVTNTGLYTFSIATNTTAFPAYTSGGVAGPNSRNVSVSIFDNPNTYTIPFVIPPQQQVTVAASWNTTLLGFTAAASVNQLAPPAMASYINSIVTGQPINILELTAVFQMAVALVLPTINLTTLTFSVTINGYSVSVQAGTSIILGDPEGYFYCSPTGATSVQA
jgi:hypothetical protein